MTKKKTNKTAEKKTDDRARVWTFIMYPESAPENWIWRLKSTHVPMAVSPLHDKDKKEDAYGEPIKDTKELKKAHWHVILYFDGKKSYEQVKEISDMVNAAPPERVGSVRGMSRYLVHLDDPEKHLYDKDLIIQINGADISDYLAFGVTELNCAKKEIQRYIITFNIVEFSDISDYALENEPAWYYVLTNTHSSYFHKYIQSRRHSQEGRKNKRSMMVTDEGELI